MAFVCIVPGQLLSLFFQGIATVADHAVISWGPEKVVCNAFTPTGDLLFSGSVQPTSSNLSGVEELELPIGEIVEQIEAEESPLPEQVVCQHAGTLFEVYPHIEAAEHPEEILISSVEVISKEKSHTLPARIEYPVKFYIDTDVLLVEFNKIKAGEYIIVSWENGTLHLASRDWTSQVTIPDGQIVLDRVTPGEYSSMHSYGTLKGVVEALGIFASVKIGMGEDLPLVLAGFSPELKLGYMITQLMEDN